MIDNLATWRSTLAALPKVSDNSWAANFAGWVADRLSPVTAVDTKGIETDPLVLTLVSPPPAGFVFTFPEASFATALQALSPTTDASAGIQSFADAWEDALNSLVFPASLSVTLGAFAPPTSPTTLFSSVTMVTLVPASITAGKNKIIELATSTPVDDPNLSEFPVKFREAFLLLKIKVVGLDSTTPTPVPLTVDNIPLI